VSPHLVARGEQSKPYTVRYDAVNALLLNEFLKEHRKVKQQEATIAQQDHKIQEPGATITRLQKEMEFVITRLEEQASQIRKVSAQFAPSEFVPSSYGIEWPLLVCTDCRSGLSTIPLRLISSRKLLAVTGWPLSA
jgi:uncharacterized coiled-coil protein SlyX